MVQFNTRANEILLKLVYYGPGLSGKTTNLQMLHAMCDEGKRGEMFSVNTQEDRTLFFDLLPINLGYIYGNAVHLQIYTVPGQVQYDASRRVVLGGADGVVFVADSSESKMQENVDSLSNLYHNLNANRLNIKQIPFVIQYNKRDLPDAMAVGVMNRRLNFRSVPYFESVAYKGSGVLETFLSIARDTVGFTFKKYHLDKKIKDFDEMLNLIESNIRATMHEPPQAAEQPAAPAPEVTVLRHSNVSVNDLPSGKPADAQELLEDALKSNMETARLYSELKSAKDNLERKNEEMAQLYQQLERANQDNLKTRRYLEGLVQNIGDALISFAPDGKILTWNNAAERIFQYGRQEIVGKSMSLLVVDSEVAETERHLHQVMNQGQILKDIEGTRMRKGGVAFPARVTYAPVRGADDRVLAVSAIVRDMEDQVSLQGQVAQSSKYEALGRLVPGFFHEVANRLTPVLLESRLILESAIDPHQAEQATRLVKASESVQTLLEPLLVVLDPPTPNRTAVDLNALVKEAARLVEPQAQRMAASVDLNLDPSLTPAGLDGAMIHWAVAILSQQALKAMAQSPTKRLRFATRRSGESIQILVQDSGTPLTEAEQAALFRPINANAPEHLALPLADSVARQHGGKVSVRSQMGLGNAYLIELPFQAPPAPAPAPGLSRTSLKGLRALVVDDESFLLECLTEALQAWGVDATPASRGDAAVAKLQEAEYDVILSDIRMPGLTGMELYAWLQSNRPDLCHRILFTTGDVFDQQTQAFLESNKLPHLAKPFDLKKLKGGVAQLAGITL